MGREQNGMGIEWNKKEENGNGIEIKWDRTQYDGNTMN